MGEPSIADLAVRLVASLAVVVGILLLIARGVNKRFAAPKGAAVQVVHRQAIGRGQGVAVVAVGTRVLVLGTTEHQVTLLAEVEPDEIGIDLDPESGSELGPGSGAGSGAGFDTERGDAHGAPTRTRTALAGIPGMPGPLAGSLLSLQTWRQAAAAVTGRGAKTPAATTTGTTIGPPTEVPSTGFADLLADAVPDERAS